MSHTKTATRVLSFALIASSVFTAQTSSAKSAAQSPDEPSLKCRATNGPNNAIAFTLTQQQQVLTLTGASEASKRLDYSFTAPDASKVYVNNRYEVIVNQATKQVARNFKRTDGEIVPNLSAQFRNLRCQPTANQ